MSEEKEASARLPVALLIEDEPQVRRYLRASLPARGFQLLEALTGEEGVQLTAQHLPDVVLLDLGLPDLDGLEVIRRIREWSQVPIIVLSARGREGQKVEALDAGADDYLTKPFGFSELLARIRVALRHATAVAPDGGSVFECGPLRLDFGSRRVYLDGEEVHLTRIEYRLLTTLAKHAGKVVTHKQLLEEVWGRRGGSETHYVRVYMTHLRRKLEPDPAKMRFFVTEAGVGYRLECGE